MKKGILSLAVAGSFVLAGAQASAWSGELVKCDATPGLAVSVSFKKGMTCSNTTNKVAIKLADKDSNAVDGCTASATAPWDVWVSKKVGKLTADAAASIARADVSIKGKTHGTCNFDGNPESSAAFVGGKVQFRDVNGEKVKGAAASFFGGIAGETGPTGPTGGASGLITKGMGVGGRIALTAAIDTTTTVEDGTCYIEGVCNGGPNDTGACINELQCAGYPCDGAMATGVCSVSSPACAVPGSSCFPNPFNGLVLACNSGAICTAPGTSLYLGGDDVFIPGPDPKTQPAPRAPISTLLLQVTGAQPTLVMALGSPEQTLCDGGVDDGLPCVNDDNCDGGSCEVDPSDDYEYIP